MDFKEVDQLFNVIENLPEGNIAERITPWKKIKKELNRIEHQISEIEASTENIDDQSCGSETDSESDSPIDIQNSLQDIDSAISKIKKGKLDLSEIQNLYLDTVKQINKCEQYVENINLSVFKQGDSADSLSEVSFN